MEINAFLLHVIVFSVVAIYFFFRYISAQRENSTFELYRIRDELVYLVASGVVNESDPVFAYYYKRVNSVLSMAPNVGLDDILHALFSNSKNLDKSLEKTKKEVDKILASESAQKDEVKCVVEQYYWGIRRMMLSHSSILRIVLLLARRFNPFRLLLERKLSKSNPIRGALKVTEYAEREANELHGGPCPC